MKKYLYVSDKPTISEMKQIGFKLIKEYDDFCIFRNAPEKFEFCHIDKTKLFETDGKDKIRLNY